MIQVKLSLPYYKKNSKALMTMNVYRNAHYRQQVSFKRKYGDICSQAIQDAMPVGVLGFVRLTFELHIKPTAGRPIKSDPYRA